MEYNNIYEEPKGTIVRGFVGALIGALLGSVVWAIVGVLGYVASIVGFLIAFLASKGYDLMKGRPGKCKLIILILCVILAVLVGDIGTTLYQIHAVYLGDGYNAYIAEAEFYKIMVPSLAQDSEFLAAIAKDSALGLVFALLGCFGLLKQTVSKPKADPVTQPVDTPDSQNPQ